MMARSSSSVIFGRLIVATTALAWSRPLVSGLIVINLALYALVTLGLNGGVLASLIDTATFWAVFLRLPEDDGLVNVDLKLNYLKPVRDGHLRAEGRCLRAGRQVSYAEASVFDDGDELVAHGTSTLGVVASLETLEREISRAHHVLDHARRVPMTDSVIPAEEVAAEVLHQIKYHHTVGDLLPDEIIHSWFLDPGVAWDPQTGHNNNETPLLINTAGSWTQRPTARTPIPNLMMSGDFVQTDIDLATMEGANESARHAVNAILEESGSKAEQVTTFKMYDPPEFEILKRTDKLLYKLGQKNLLDVL